MYLKLTVSYDSTLCKKICHLTDFQGLSTMLFGPQLPTAGEEDGTYFYLQNESDMMYMNFTFDFGDLSSLGVITKA